MSDQETATAALAKRGSSSSPAATTGEPAAKKEKRAPEALCMFDKVQAARDYISSKIAGKTPLIGIICGSGLGTLADRVADPIVIPYCDIPHFPQSKVAGHAGLLIVGTLGGALCIVMKGRTHIYEGVPLSEITIPVRAMALLGIKFLFVTNAAGGLNEQFNVGDIMVLKDHINFPGFAGNNPLVGPHDDRFGPRFVPTSKAYDKALQAKAHEIAQEMQMDSFVQSGVYATVGGPCYESVAEARAIKMLGADAVGMSTVPEVIVAVQMGVRCFALSLITNNVVVSYESSSVADHAEVVDAAKKRENDVQNLFEALCKAARHLD